MSFQKVIELEALEEGKIRTVKTKDLILALVRIEKTIYAFEDACSHDGEEISCGELRGTTLICPRHFAEFDITTGKVLKRPATEPLSLFPVKVEGGEVFVDWEEGS
ncbi:toluene 1,2-dioxygenase system ferredoxin subunit family protein [Leptospira ryugenii]|uniref:Toluene 1,2-dioxygenase system ferredoxin subunit family protein n=1 Tax=Leptospira ryugenii TaxID=1917863 RepID=A0A2P2DWB4_9LEPT|nr:Rieske 2Fe-2S domain-containing protein [Leptospira ryugenii]GBF48929.1 toluene 1,2-dioxygenase system ferredoxin subunit family protein [Leptospira ryugenii]